MIEDDLKKAGYKYFKPPLDRDQELYQKRFSDERGIKYFINFYKTDFTRYNNAVRGLPDYMWEVQVQFRNEDRDITMNANTSWTLEENPHGLPISTIEDVEKFYEDLFKLLKFDYYDLD